MRGGSHLPAEQGDQGLRGTRGGTASRHCPRQADYHHPQPERRPAPALRHLLQSPLALSAAIAAQDGEAPQGRHQGRGAEVRRITTTPRRPLIVFARRPPPPPRRPRDPPPYCPPAVGR